GLSYNFDKTVQLPLSFNLDDRLKAATLKDLFNLDASAPLSLSIGGRVSLGLTIDLTTPTAPVFSIADSSKVSFTTLLNASNINLQAGVGPLGITVAGGHVFLDSGTPGTPATWAVSLAPTPTHRYNLGTLIGNPGSVVQTSLVGRLDVDLPVSFPTADQPQGHIHLKVANLGNVAGSTTLDPLPNFAGAIGNLNLDDLIGVVVEGLDRMLAQIEKRFNLPNLPLIGNDLQKATAFLHDIRQRVIASLEEMSTFTSDLVRQKIFEALGPGGLNYLADRNGDSKIDANDVSVNFSTNEKRAEVAFRLGGTYALGQPIHADLGLRGLGLNLDANLKLAVGFRFDVGFGVSSDDGFYLLTGAPGSAPELQVNLKASISDPQQLAQLQATLGFLQLTAADQPVSQPDGGKGSYLAGLLTLALVDPRTAARAARP